MDDGWMEFKSGAQGGSREDAHSETGTWPTAAVAFLPRKAAASLRADVMFTRPQGSSTHTTDVQSWEHHNGHSTGAPQKRSRPPKKITAWVKMLTSMYYLYANTKEMATCQWTESPKTVTKSSFRNREESFYVNLTGRPAPPEISLCWLQCGGILFIYSPWPILYR